MSISQSPGSSASLHMWVKLALKRPAVGQAPHRCRTSQALKSWGFSSPPVTAPILSKYCRPLDLMHRSSCNDVEGSQVENHPNINVRAQPLHRCCRFSPGGLFGSAEGTPPCPAAPPAPRPGRAAEHRSPAQRYQPAAQQQYVRSLACCGGCCCGAGCYLLKAS